MNRDIDVCPPKPCVDPAWPRGVLALAICALFFSVTTLAPGGIEAQVTAADSAAVLLQAATAFEQDGQWEVAEALLIHITERYGGTPAALTASSRLAAAPADRVGRVSGMELPVFGTLYGLWLGVAVPAVLGTDSEEALGAGLLIGGPVGLFTSRAYQRRKRLTEGQTRAVSWGGIWGTWQGIAVAELLDLGEGSDACFGCVDSGSNSEEVLAAGIIGGLAGIATGAVIARNPVRSGVASGAQGGSTWASIYGLMGAGLFDADDGDAVLATMLVTGNLGLLAGGALAAKYDVSRPRVRMINLGALVGGFAGLGIDLLVGAEDKSAIAIPMITSLAGLGIAIGATRGGAPAAGGDNDLASALFDYRDGRLSIGTGLPLPTLLRVEDRFGETSWTPGLTLEVFRAKF